MPRVEVRLEILDARGKVVRTYSSTEPVFDPDPGKDMAAYDEVCQKTPTAAYCGLPLYWPAPQFIVSPKAGMHRFSWDLKFDPVSPADLVPAGDEEATGAVPGPHVSELQRAVGRHPGSTPFGSPLTARRRRSRLWSGSIRACGSRRRHWPS